MKRNELLLIATGALLSSARSGVGQEPQVMALVVSFLNLSSHVMDDGLRWQMIPVYLLHLWHSINAAIILLSIYFADTSAPTRALHSLNDTSTWIPYLELAACLIFSAISFVLAFILPVVDLPNPDGPYDVGTRTFQLAIKSSNSSSSSSSSPTGPLLVKVFYPSEPRPGAFVSSSIPDEERSSVLGRIMNKVNSTREDPEAVRYKKRHRHLLDTDLLNAISKGMDGLPAWALSHLKHSTSFSIEGAPLINVETASNHTKKLPIIIFSHGLRGCPELYMHLCEEAASRGFLVLAPYHTDGSGPLVKFPKDTAGQFTIPHRKLPFHSPSKDADRTDEEHTFRNSQLLERVADVQRLLDALFISEGKQSKNQIQFAFSPLGDFSDDNESFAAFVRKSIDLDKVSICGHSFGACTSIAASRVDPRLKAAIAIDAWLYPMKETEFDASSKHKTPVLFVSSDLWQWKRNLEKMDAIVQHTSNSIRTAIKGTQHHNFNDLPFVGPYILKKLHMTGPAEHKRVFEQTLGLWMSFLVMNQAASNCLSTNSKKSEKEKEEQDAFTRRIDPSEYLSLLNDEKSSESILVQNASKSS